MKRLMKEADTQTLPLCKTKLSAPPSAAALLVTSSSSRLTQKLGRELRKPLECRQLTGVQPKLQPGASVRARQIL